MTRWSRPRDGDGPVAPEPGTMGLPACPAARPARRRGARAARIWRTRWWPRFLVTGVLAVVVGTTLISGGAALWVTLAGVMIIFVIVYWALAKSLGEIRGEPPIPPGSPGPGGG